MAAGALFVGVVTGALIVFLVLWRQADRLHQLAESRLEQTIAARNYAEAKANEQLLRWRTLTGYASDMYLAQDNWRSGNYLRTSELLARYQSRNGEDPRESVVWTRQVAAGSCFLVLLRTLGRSNEWPS